jgi:pyruvate formate lyase activating enzyme
MRNFVKKTLATLFVLVIAAGAAFIILKREGTIRREEAPAKFHTAMFFDKLMDKIVRCRLCPNQCMLSPGQYGRCKARKNIDGKLYSLVYGRIATWHIDPIEKKPFFHVLPGGTALSIATTGCNMQCLFCQNWEISQAYPFDAKTQQASPENIVELALANRSNAIAFTYSEPTIYYEYMLDIARRAKTAGIKTLVISNGYIEKEPLEELLKYVDAYKVDFKGMNEEFYQKMTDGHLAPVLETMKTIQKSGVWLEVVNLLVTGQNDSDAQILALSTWVRDNLGPDVPLHFSRFSPKYKLLHVPATPEATVIRARDIALKAGLHYVYTGNIAYAPGEVTLCPRSGARIIVREGMFTSYNGLKDGLCPDGEKIPGIWQ